MANLMVQNVKNSEKGIASKLEDPRDAFEMIRKRAFEMFERHGGSPGQELDDWFRAERDLFWVPAAELAETDEEVKITVSVPGFDPKEIKVTAQPGEVQVRGNHGQSLEKKEKGVVYSEFNEKDLFRRFELPQTIDVDHISVNVENGILTVKIPKKIPQTIEGKKTATAAS
jgi:HSP20 family molecular chaperone IbpA